MTDSALTPPVVRTVHLTLSDGPRVRDGAGAVPPHAPGATGPALARTPETEAQALARLLLERMRAAQAARAGSPAADGHDPRDAAAPRPRL